MSMKRSATCGHVYPQQHMIHCLDKRKLYKANGIGKYEFEVDAYDKLNINLILCSFT